MGSLDLAFLIVPALLTGVGAFLRFDGYPSHDFPGLVAEAVGWIGFVVLGAIGETQLAQERSDCAVFGRCEGVAAPQDVWWEDWLKPLLAGTVKAGLAGGACVALGWLLAKATARRSA